MASATPGKRPTVSVMAASGASRSGASGSTPLAACTAFALRSAASTSRRTASSSAGPRHPPFRVRCYEVDAGWIEAEKAAHAPTAEVPFVSTNDVITSWFLRRGGYDYALMTVNMRPYIDGLTAAHAGNYIQTVNYFPEMFATPAGIRLPLNNKLRAPRYDEVPTAAERFRLRMASITSWTSFSDDFSSLPGCARSMHVPFRNPRTGVLQTAGGWMDSALIFRPTPTTAAIMILDRSHETSEESVLADPAIRRPLFPLSHAES